MSRPGCSLYCETRISTTIEKRYASKNRSILIVSSLFNVDPVNDAEWLDQESLEHVLHHVVQDDVKRALDALPEAYRMVVLLADMADLSYKDIAAIIGCPEGTVMSLLFRGRRLLRKSLQEFARKGGYVKG